MNPAARREPALGLPPLPRFDLRRRSDAPEWMDGLPAPEYERCLADLAAVNRMTLTHRAPLAWLDAATHGWSRGRPVRVLDVGCGHGDLLRAIHRRLLQRGLVPLLQGLDLNPLAQTVARAATSERDAIEYLQGDVFSHRPEPDPHFIVTAQFTHHLSDAQLALFVRWMERHARRGWFIADLERRALALHGFRLLARARRWHPVVRHDGCVSVARAFRRAEWQRLLAAEGIPAVVSWHLPFRLCVSRLRHG